MNKNLKEEITGQIRYWCDECGYRHRLIAFEIMDKHAMLYFVDAGGTGCFVLVDIFLRENGETQAYYEYLRVKQLLWMMRGHTAVMKENWEKQNDKKWDEKDG